MMMPLYKLLKYINPGYDFIPVFLSRITISIYRKRQYQKFMKDGGKHTNLPNTHLWTFYIKDFISILKLHVDFFAK